MGPTGGRGQRLEDAAAGRPRTLGPRGLHGALGRYADQGAAGTVRVRGEAPWSPTESEHGYVLFPGNPLFLGLKGGQKETNLVGQSHSHLWLVGRGPRGVQ